MGMRTFFLVIFRGLGLFPLFSGYGSWTADPARPSSPPYHIQPFDPFRFLPLLLPSLFAGVCPCAGLLLLRTFFRVLTLPPIGGVSASLGFLFSLGFAPPPPSPFPLSSPLSSEILSEEGLTRGFYEFLPVAIPAEEWFPPPLPLPPPSWT